MTIADRDWFDTLYLKLPSEITRFEQIPPEIFIVFCICAVSNDNYNIFSHTMVISSCDSI